MKKYVLLFTLFSCAQLPQSGFESSKVEAPTASRIEGPTFKETHPRICLNAGRDTDISILGLLEKDGYRIIRLREKLSEPNLRNCDIVYVSSTFDPRKMSRRGVLNSKEVDNLHRWVRAGGGLLVVPPSLSLMRKFGVNLKRVRPITNSDIFPISENQMNITSPIILGRNESERLHNIYHIYVNALKGPEYTDAFLKTGEKKFPAAALSLKLGRGRAVMFSDANIFTSHLAKKLKGVKDQDNSQMALNVFHWLSNEL